jgi:acetylornithine deacetylase/succinyl-diaminopimelate desuccinylase-like protein
MVLGRPMICAGSHRDRFVSDLVEFVRFPSISADPRRAGDVKRCAGWLADHLQAIGLNHVRVIGTPRHPIVYADWLGVPGRPTVLIYGHYDVQPADPLSAWTVPPFGGILRYGKLFGRGASDDKGQMLAYVKALELLLRRQRRLPVNVKCLFEGEEEIGSPSLVPFLRRHRRGLAADVVVMSDSPMASARQPAITYAVRGALELELTVLGPGRDLHSGLFGGAIHNPAEALCALIAGLHDQGRRVAIPGFYDRVRQVPAAERAFMAHHGPSDAALLRAADARRSWGEPGYTLYERVTIRPALTINGLSGGYQGPGGKAVIPARASAKLSFRLVPDQDPREIERLFREHLEAIVPATVRCQVRTTSGSRPALVDRRHPAFQAAIAACRTGFGMRPAFQRMGGSIPVVAPLQEQLGVPAVLLGFGPPNAGIHGPDEHFPLAIYFRAIVTCAAFLEEAGRRLGPARRGCAGSRRTA